MKTTTIFADLQGFKTSENDFIVKEFALATIEWTQVFLVKPPYAYASQSSEEKRQTNWIERNRGIFWSEGFIDYREFKRIIPLYLEDQNIVIKGHEKIKWIKNLCEDCNIVELGDKGCPNLMSLHEKYKNCDLNCINHKKQCALKNVCCLRKWYYDNHINQFKLFEIK